LDNLESAACETQIVLAEIRHANNFVAQERKLDLAICGFPLQACGKKK
jgi:hypothetical protein